MFKLSDYFNVPRDLAAEGDGGAPAAPVTAPAPATDAPAPSAPLLSNDQPPAEAVPEPFLQALPAADDADGWNSLYAKLGRPEKADGYELPLPEGDDGSFAKQTSEWMHAAGLNKQQAQSLATAWNSHQAAQAEAMQKYQEECVATVKKEWGSNFDANLSQAKAALSTFAPEGFIDYLNQTGQANNPMMLNMLQKIGSAISEDKLVGSNKDSSQPGEKSLAQQLWPGMS